MQIRAVFSKRRWREEEKGGGPAMESQGTGAGEGGGQAGRRGERAAGAREKREEGRRKRRSARGARGAILVNKAKNIE